MDETTIDLVISWYENNPWLNGIHIHVGSQGTPLEKFVRGAEVGKTRHTWKFESTPRVKHDKIGLKVTCSPR